MLVFTENFADLGQSQSQIDEQPYSDCPQGSGFLFQLGALDALGLGSVLLSGRLSHRVGQSALQIKTQLTWSNCRALSVPVNNKGHILRESESNVGRKTEHFYPE